MEAPGVAPCWAAARIGEQHLQLPTGGLAVYPAAVTQRLLPHSWRRPHYCWNGFLPRCCHSHHSMPPHHPRSPNLAAAPPRRTPPPSPTHNDAAGRSRTPRHRPSRPFPHRPSHRPCRPGGSLCLQHQSLCVPSTSPSPPGSSHERPRPRSPRAPRPPPECLTPHPPAPEPPHAPPLRSPGAYALMRPARNEGRWGVLLPARREQSSWTAGCTPHHSQARHSQAGTIAGPSLIRDHGWAEAA